MTYGPPSRIHSGPTVRDADIDVADFCRDLRRGGHAQPRSRPGAARNADAGNVGGRPALPVAGWLEARTAKRPTVRLSAIEPVGLHRMHRIVQIHLNPYESDAPSAMDFMATHAAPAVHIRPFTFKNLGQGILWETAATVTEDDDERRVTPPELYACIVVPRSAHSSDSVAIGIGLVGPMIFGPSSVELIQSIADSLVLAPNGAER